MKSDEHLQQRARESAQRSLRVLFLSLGFREVNFVDALPVASAL